MVIAFRFVLALLLAALLRFLPKLLLSAAVR